MHKWLILIFLLWTAANAEPAYRWLDADGQVHYSDRPIPGSTPIELATGGAAPRPASAAQPSGSAPEREAAQDPALAYQAFNVLQPAQQETLWGTGGTVDVVVEISPALQSDHHLGYYLDGVLTDLGSRSEAFQLQEVVRGIHTLQAAILDDAGEEVLRSLALTFMVQQTSVNFPQNPNNPNRPRPTQ